MSGGEGLCPQWHRYLAMLGLPKPIRKPRLDPPTPRYRLVDEYGLPLADLVNVRDARTVERIAAAVVHHGEAVETLIETRTVLRGLALSGASMCVMDQLTLNNLLIWVTKRLEKINAVTVDKACDEIIAHLDKMEETT